MARLLLLKAAGANRKMHPGDVVTVQPDGHVWGAAEREQFVTLDVPGVPPAAFAELLDEVRVNNRLYLYRRVHLDLSALLALGPAPTFEQVMAARRVPKRVTPLLS